MSFKKTFFSLLTVFVFAFYVVYQRLNSEASVFLPPTTNKKTDIQTSVNLGPARYKDGEYIGISADAYYGRVEVVAIIEGGHIARIQFLDFPQEQDTSKAINGMAVPILEQEAIVAQSAEVDTVSGATQTSKAFKQSLASALVKAKL